MRSSKLIIFHLFSLFVLIGAGCTEASLDDSGVLDAQQTSDSSVMTEEEPSQEPCVLPQEWDEVQSIFKDCGLKEVEKSSGFEATFNPEGGNGLFGYCNTLVFRGYQTKAGGLYTYEKIRSVHFPNSEVGEYRISKELYDSITNARPCTSSEETRFEGLTDDELSSKLFPSRNFKVGVDLPDVSILRYVPSVKEKEVVKEPTPLKQETIVKEQITTELEESVPEVAPNGTYVNTYGNEVPRPYEAPSAPAGASAQCRDGTYSFSQSRRGTCSHHGGVDVWL